MTDDWLSGIHFGAIGKPLPAPAVTLDDADADELAETPADVVAVLGFDPMDEPTHQLALSLPQDYSGGPELTPQVSRLVTPQPTLTGR